MGRLPVQNSMYRSVTPVRSMDDYCAQAAARLEVGHAAVEVIAQRVAAQAWRALEGGLNDDKGSQRPVCLVHALHTGACQLPHALEEHCMAFVVLGVLTWCRELQEPTACPSQLEST